MNAGSTLRAYVRPAGLSLLTVAGLVLSLAASGAWDVAALALVGAPLAALVFFAMRPRSSARANFKTPST
jgi:hypothetical protein